MVEVINANVGLVAALFISGAALGVIVARFTLPGPKRVAQLEERLDKAEKEHEVYRAGVTTHFKTTAELVGEMTQSYKAVYDHLAHGAQSLCGEYDALTSSVFGASRIIHDPKVAIGETLVAEAAATATADEKNEAAAAESVETPSADDTTGDGDTAAPETPFSMTDTTDNEEGTQDTDKAADHEPETKPAGNSAPSAS
jgi:uncharacterized membrane-anchored protein YhcB (DUF1043 family)